VAPIREARELGLKGLGVQVEDVAEFGNVLGGGAGLAVEEGCDCDFVAAESFG
jgi:hypothetical protein